MLQKLIERKSALEKEINLMTYIDRPRPRQIHERQQLESELRNVEYQINEITKKEPL